MASFGGDRTLFSLNGEGDFDVDGVRVLVRCGEIAQAAVFASCCRDDRRF